MCKHLALGASQWEVNFKYNHKKSITMPRPRVFFDIQIDNVDSGRIVFELYNDVVPKTAENFRLNFSLVQGFRI